MAPPPTIIKILRYKLKRGRFFRVSITGDNLPPILPPVPPPLTPITISRVDSGESMNVTNYNMISGHLMYIWGTVPATLPHGHYSLNINFGGLTDTILYAFSLAN